MFIVVKLFSYHSRAITLVEFPWILKSYIANQSKTRSFQISFYFGAETAGSFELLVSISDWLFANKMSGIFKLPKIDTEAVRLQRLNPSYLY